MQDIHCASSSVVLPPALRMAPTDLSTLGSLFAPVVGTFASPLNVLRQNSLQMVPPLRPAYMTMQQPPSVPAVPVTVAPSTGSSRQTVRPAVSVSSHLQAPPLRMHLPPNTVSQSSRLVTSSLQMLRPETSSAVSSLQPSLLHHRSHNTSQCTAAERSVKAVLTAANSVRPSPPPLRIRLSYCAPHSTAAVPTNFRCFTLVSTKSTVGSSLPHSAVSVAISSVARNSTSSGYSQVSSGISAPRQTSSAASLENEVIDVDEGSSLLSELTVSDEGNENAAVMSSSVESSYLAVSVISSSSGVPSRTNTVVRGRSARRIFPHSNSPIQPLHAGVDCLRQIFQYLDILTRLQAAQVCRCWRRMALQQHLVNSVLFFYINGCYNCHLCYLSVLFVLRCCFCLFLRYITV